MTMIRQRLGVWCAVLGVITAISGCAETDPAAGGGPPAGAAAGQPTAATDPCTLVSAAELTQIVGNPVLEGTGETPGTCKWGTKDPGEVDVLLIFGAPGSEREKYICPDIRKASSSDPALAGVGDAVTWKFSSVGALFNSGDLESCGRKGYVSLSLNGKRDEATLKAAAVAIARKIIDRP